MNLDGKTKVLGIFGDPVAHSLSPKMQNAAIAAAGINAVYVPFHIRPEQLKEAVSAIRIVGLLGVNLTVPHKESVLPFLDEIDAHARLIGAVNTVVNRNGQLTGYNTDGEGFLLSLKRDLEFAPTGKSVVVLGAGGATRAAVVALAGVGARRITISNRTAEKAGSLAREFSGHFPDTEIAAMGLEEDSLQPVLAKADLLVNTTTIGLHGESFPLPVVDMLPQTAAYYDMVYTSGLTPLQAAARRRDVEFADGRGMLAGQGEAAFHIWFGCAPPEHVMLNEVAK